MKKKIIALIVVIPLLFMLAIYSSSAVVSVNVFIPVQAIKINNSTENGVIELDIASNIDDVNIDVSVLPVTAKNRGYSFNIEAVGNNKMCDLQIDDVTGKLSASSVGQAKVTAVSKEGNFKDSVIVLVSSSKVLDFVPKIKSINGDINLSKVTGEQYQYEVSLPSDSNCVVLLCDTEPTNFSDANINWQSDNENVVSVSSVTGKIQTYLSGSAIVSATIKDGLLGDIVKKIKFNVEKIKSNSYISINGSDTGAIFAKSGASQVVCFVENLSPNIDNIVLSGGGANILSHRFDAIEGSTTQYKLIINFAENHENKIVFNLKLQNENVSQSVEVTFSDYFFNIFNKYHTSLDNQIFQKQNSKVQYVVEENLVDENVTFKWNANNTNVLRLVEQDNGRSCTIEALSEGECAITVSAFKGLEKLSEITVNKLITIVSPVTSLLIDKNSVTYGIGNMLAFGNTEIKSGSYVKIKPEVNLLFKTPQGFKKYFGEDVVFESSDKSILQEYVTLDGLKLNIIGNGIATLSAKWKYAEYFGDNVSASIAVNCVDNGVNVSSYADLKRATDDGKAVVLQKNIMLGKQNASIDELKLMACELPTNYNWKYYQNLEQARPSVKYLIEFKNNVHGNGFSIDADYITQAKDSVGKPKLFSGPLNFVAISTASVKAQDNIVFLVRKDNVLIDNVVLKGCSDESLSDAGQLNLSKLNYVGTTLELMGDTRITNCRINNGRNVVRIFGGDTTNSTQIVKTASEVDVQKERVTVKIESCILSNAREFILKIGSNRAISSSGLTAADYKVATLNRLDGTPYNQFANNLADKGFVDNYLIADVTLKNSVLATSGLFSIGMETHFSGEMLGNGSMISSWQGIAATSFATALRFEGDVKMLDWKIIENVDSSTLIETTGDAKPFLTLDIAKMLTKVFANGGNEYQQLLSKFDGKDYVHGGIAVYGGGYNYANFDFSKFDGEMPYDYKINLSILAEGITNQDDPLYLQGTMLPLAAGKQDFRFLIYGQNSKNNLQKQINMIADGSAYSWIMPAVN